MERICLNCKHLSIKTIRDIRDKFGETCYCKKYGIDVDGYAVCDDFTKKTPPNYRKQ